MTRRDKNTPTTVDAQQRERARAALTRGHVTPEQRRHMSAPCRGQGDLFPSLAADVEDRREVEQ